MIFRRFWPLLFPIVGWLLLALFAYAWVRISFNLAAAAWPTWFGVLALTAVLTTAGFALLMIKREWRAVAALAVAVLVAGVGYVTVDWESTYVDSQVSLHSDELNQLEADFLAGNVREGTALPESLRTLSVDGKAHIRDYVIFIATYKDRRTSQAAGIAWFRSGTPPDGYMVVTSTSDLGSAQREVGEGWWWVA